MQHDYAKHDDMASLIYSNTGGVTAFPPKRNLAPRFHEAKEAKNKTLHLQSSKEIREVLGQEIFRLPGGFIF